MTPLQRRLQRFVDRKSEMRRFCTVLDAPNPERPILVVRGASGYGKSSLLLRMREECNRRGLGHTAVEFTSTRNQDYLAIMRTIRDDVARNGFPTFSTTADFYTNPGAIPLRIDIGGPGSISVASQMTVSGQVGDVIGVKIQDCNFTVPRADLAIAPGEMCAQITKAFAQDFAASFKTGPLILFLDAFQIAAEATRTWVIEELVGGVIDGRLEQLVLVIAAQERPALLGDQWFYVEDMELGPLPPDDIREYVMNSHLPGELDFNTVAACVANFSKGVPVMVAGMVETLARSPQLNAA